MGDERRRGKLVLGYLADLVVLDRDLLTLLRKSYPTQVVATMPGGRWVHNPPLGTRPVPGNGQPFGRVCAEHDVDRACLSHETTPTATRPVPGTGHG